MFPWRMRTAISANYRPPTKNPKQNYRAGLDLQSLVNTQIKILSISFFPVEPQAPILVQQSAALDRSRSIEVVDGQSVQLSCESRVGKPAPKVTWAITEDWEAQQLIAPIVDGSGSEGSHSLHSALHPMRGGKGVCG